MLKSFRLFLFILLSFLIGENGASQCLLTGADLSYVNTVEQNGGVFRDEQGSVVDPYAYFAAEGASMIRLRLWHSPQNITDHCGNPISSSNLSDVLVAARRIQAQGMQLNLSIHYGDYFNDPSKQLMPAAWMGLPHAVLLDSIYVYTYGVLEKLFQQNTPPAMVGIGNETTWGFVDASVPTDGFTWPEDAEKFQSALQAVDDFNQIHQTEIKRALHFTESTAAWAADLFHNQGIDDYEVIGFSYYPFFSPDTRLEEVGQLIADLSNTYNREVMLFETGFIWTQENGDTYPDFISHNGNVLSQPISPEGQKAFLSDLSQVVYDRGGTGLLYWEPGWISSGLCDAWGQGSSYENASFFDFRNDQQALPAFDFFDFCKTLSGDAPVYLNGFKVYPNPMSQTIVFSYTLNQPAKPVLRIYNNQQQEIALLLDKWQEPGNHQLDWPVSHLSKGVYQYVFQAGDRFRTGLLLKVSD